MYTEAVQKQKSVVENGEPGFDTISCFRNMSKVFSGILLINFVLTLVFGMYTKSTKYGHPHSTARYRRLLDKLVNRERLENIAINYPVTDSDDEDQEETEDNAILATEKGNLSINLDRPKIVGIIENNVLPKGTFISIKK